HNCGGYNSPMGGDNRGAWLGAIMGELAVAGRDKLTLVASPPLAPFGPWAEQLIAESTGKEGTGILPVEGETVGSPDSYGDDRLFVYMSLRGEEDDRSGEDLVRAGHPVVRIPLADIYDLGGEMSRWEMATAIAGRRLGINLFNQLTADDERDAPIPDEAGGAASSLTFGVLKEAQALGDRQALLDRGRRFIRLHLGTDVERGLAKLAGMVA